MEKKIKVLLILLVLSVSVLFLYKGVSTKMNITEKETIQGTNKEQESAEISSESTEAIWQQIINELPNLRGTKILSVKKQEEDIYLDMDEAFGIAFRAMGTAEENEVITKIVNLYLKELKGERVLITEEGKVLESGHKLYNEFLEK